MNAKTEAKVDTLLKDPETKKKIDGVIRGWVKENTPLPGNICHCGGQVVRKISSLFQGRFYYHLPTCGKCGRVYFWAGSAAKVGEKEFIDRLNRPFTT